jgi:superkiller protein 3
MGIVSGDAALVDAALSEILALPPARRTALDPARDVTDLLAQVHRAQGDAAGAAGVYRDALAAEPSADALRRQLAALVEPAEALEVLDEGAGARDLDEVRETVAVRALAAGRAGDVRGALEDAQKAVALAPWETRNWEVLAFVRSQPVDSEDAPADSDKDADADEE